MRKCKRFLSVITSALILTSSFALPYGAAAEGAESVPSSANDFGQAVAWFDDKSNTQNASGKYLNYAATLAEPVALDGKITNYMLTMEVKLTSTHAGSADDVDWMRFIMDGGLNIVSDGVKKNVSLGAMTAVIPEALQKQAATDYVPVQFSLTSANFADVTSISQIELYTYTHFDRDTGELKELAETTNITLAVRNAQLVDVRKNAQGGVNENLVMFMPPEVEMVTPCSQTGAHQPTIIPQTNALYNIITEDMDASKLNLEFDIKYSGDINAAKIQNGNPYLFSPSSVGGPYQWINGVVKETDTWYHVSYPVSNFTGVTPSAITAFKAVSYNDDGNKPFTSTVKNLRITHSDVTALRTELEKSVNYLYDADESAAAYDTLRNEAKKLFDDPNAQYADFASALAELNTARETLNGFREVSYNVAHYTAQEYAKTQTQYANNNQFYYDWKTADGLTSGKGFDLTDNTEDNVIGANRYFQMKVELTPNPQYTGTVDSLDILQKVQYRVRTNIGSEKRTNDYNLEVVDKAITADKVVYTMEGLIDESAKNQVEWNLVRDSIIFAYTTVKSGEDKISPVTLTLSDVCIVNKTAEAIDASVEELANATLPVGKYTAASTADYLACQAQAKAILADNDATLQEKNVLLEQAAVAKAKLEAVLTEYVQFGVPESVATFTNKGDSSNNSHGINKTYNVSKNELSDTVDISKLQVRLEIMVHRNDGNVGVANAIVNGHLQLQGTTNEIKKAFGDYQNSLLGSEAYADEWNTVYVNLSDFTNCTSVSDLTGLTGIQVFGFNDLKGKSNNTAPAAPTTDPSITVSVRNVAIIDGTNSDLLASLKAAFDDVTEGGTKDFTPESLAAYQAVYDEWYPVYQNVDLAQANEAIAAMNEARKLLVCVDTDVMTFNSWNKTYEVAASDEANVYADWTGADQGLTDISIRNRSNLRLRFDLTFAATGDTPLPETLTVAGMRLALRKQAGNPEYSLEWGKAITSLDPTKTNSIDLPFEGVSGNNEDGQLRDILMWMHINELAQAATGAYTMTISNARVVDVTKENMTAELTKAANMTVEELSIQDGVVYDESTASEYKAAQAAALELLKTANLTYAQLADAQKAIDAGKATLKVIGHTVMTFNNWNRTIYNGRNWGDAGNLGESNQFYNDWSSTTATDLTKYNEDNLHLRFNVYFGLSGQTESTVLPDTFTNKYSRLGLRSANKKAGYEDKEASRDYIGGGAIGGTTLTWGNNTIDIPLKALNTNDVINLDSVKDIIFWIQVTEITDANRRDFVMAINNARIVDVTAEENLGNVNVVGNGAVNITGDLVYGGTDTLTATTTSASTFVGWNVNTTFSRGENLTALASGSEEITAYFVDADETAVIYYGKYNKVLDVQVVKSAEELKAPAIPSIIGYTAVGWNEDNLEAAVESNKGGTTAVTAVYEADDSDQGYTITLTNAQRTNGTETSGLRFDTRVEVKAAPVEGQTFSHWELDGMAVGYEETYSFYVSGNNAVTAVYTNGEAAKPALAVGIKQTLVKEDTESGRYTISMISQTFVPAGDTVLEYGLIYAPNETIINNLDSYVMGTDYLKIVSSSRMANRQYIIYLTNVKANRTRYGKAYVTVRHENGSVETLFSAVESASTPNV